MPVALSLSEKSLSYKNKIYFKSNTAQIEINNARVNLLLRSVGIHPRGHSTIKKNQISNKQSCQETTSIIGEDKFLSEAKNDIEQHCHAPILRFEYNTKRNKLTHFFKAMNRIYAHRALKKWSVFALPNFSLPLEIKEAFRIILLVHPLILKYGLKNTGTKNVIWFWTHGTAERLALDFHGTLKYFAGGRTRQGSSILDIYRALIDLSKSIDRRIFYLVTKIQSRMRSIWGLKFAVFYRKMAENVKKKRSSAATGIQRVYRGHSSKLQVAKMRLDLANKFLMEEYLHERTTKKYKIELKEKICLLKMAYEKDQSENITLRYVSGLTGSGNLSYNKKLGSNQKNNLSIMISDYLRDIRIDMMKQKQNDFRRKCKMEFVRYKYNKREIGLDIYFKEKMEERREFMMHFVRSLQQDDVRKMIKQYNWTQSKMRKGAERKKLN